MEISNWNCMSFKRSGYVLLEIAGGFLDLAILGGGFAEIGPGSGDPVFLSVPDRPQINSSACGLGGSEGRLCIDKIEFGGEAFPAKDNAIPFYFYPFNFRDFF